MSNPSKLVNDLDKVANIVGQLGLEIAQAQKLFNYDYLVNVERLLAIVAKLAKEQAAGQGDGEAAAPQARSQMIFDLIKALAPPRYQYSETTLNVRLDLAQTMDVAAQGGIGGNFGAVTFNAALAVGYGYDYQAAAEVKTTIHAIPADTSVMSDLLARADKLAETSLTLPARSEVDSQILTKLDTLYQKLTGEAAPATTETEA